MGGEYLQEWLSDYTDKYSLADPTPFFEKDSVEAPDEGEATVGYRVAYTYKMPDGSKLFVSPLTPSFLNSKEKSFKQDYDELLQNTNKAQRYGMEPGTDYGSGVLSSNVAVHEDQSGRGYYYYSNREEAEEYMKLIMLAHKGIGKKYTFMNPLGMNENLGSFEEESNRVGLNIKSNPEQWESFKPEFFTKYADSSSVLKEELTKSNPFLGNLSLDLYRVEGIAGRKTADEGWTMNEMRIDPEPVVSVSAADAFELRSRVYEKLKDMKVKSTSTLEEGQKAAQNWNKLSDRQKKFYLATMNADAGGYTGQVNYDTSLGELQQKSLQQVDVGQPIVQGTPYKGRYKYSINKGAMNQAISNRESFYNTLPPARAVLGKAVFEDVKRFEQSFFERIEERYRDE